MPRMLLAKLRSLFRRNAVSTEITDEMQFHVDMRAGEYEREGLPAEDARRSAARRFGNMAVMHDRGYDVRGAGIMESVVQDVRYGVRLLVRDRALSIVAILTLALGIGAATAIFSVVDGVLLQPFPVRDQSSLYIVWKTLPDRGFEHDPFTYKEFEAFPKRLNTVSSIAAQPYAGAISTAARLEDGSARSVSWSAVSGNWFELFGVTPRTGRALTVADDRSGAAPVLVMSSGYATAHFGGPAAALGRLLSVYGRSYVIVGVMPAEFDYPRRTDVWIPAAWFSDSEYLAWDLAVRLAPGFTAQQMRADVESAIRTVSPESATRTQLRALPQPFAEVMVGDVRLPLLVLGGVVLLMLCVAIMNVANLLLVRNLGRQQELAVRAALGAGRGRLLAQFAGEALVLAGAAIVAAVPAAFVALAAVLRLAPVELPRLNVIDIDGRASLFAVAATGAIAVICAVLPAVHSGRAALAEAVRARGDALDPVQRRRSLRHGLAVAQVAVATLAVAVAGVLLESFDRLQRLDPGFASEAVSLAEVNVPDGRFAANDALGFQRFLMDLAARISTKPGIFSASAVVSRPFAGTHGVDGIFYAEGQRFDDGTAPYVNYEGVDAAYFSTLGVPILRGRAIESTDRAKTERVVVVNESFARMFWPGENPIGRRVGMEDEREKGKWRTVVGLAADTRYREFQSPRPSIYVPYEQGIPVAPTFIAIRTMDSRWAALAVRQVLDEVEPRAAVLDVTPLMSLLAQPLARPRFQFALAGSFAGLALFLAVVGTSAVLAFLVRQRRREIGVRMALGAQARDIRALVVGQALSIGALGIALGIGLSAAASRLVQPVLFDVSATDPRVLAGTAAVLVLAIGITTFLPMRAATQVDPAIALRSE